MSKGATLNLIFINSSKKYIVEGDTIETFRKDATTCEEK
jgi:hypothetical protein